MQIFVYTDDRIYVADGGDFNDIDPGRIYYGKPGSNPLRLEEHSTTKVVYGVAYDSLSDEVYWSEVDFYDSSGVFKGVIKRSNRDFLGGAEDIISDDLVCK